MRRILALLLLTTPALAQDATLLDRAVRADPGAVALYLQAVDLYALGQQAKDPLMVVTAARLIRGLTLTDVALLPDPAPPSQPAPTQPTSTQPAPTQPAPTQPTPSQPTLTPPTLTRLNAAAMLVTAGNLDAGANYADLIEQVARERTPRAKALSVTASILPPGKAETWTVGFYGGTHAELAILGDGRSNLDLTVRDAAGGVICADLGSADRAMCGFALRDNGEVQVTVTNAGTEPAVYMLLTQ